MGNDALIENGQLTHEAAHILGLILGTWVTFHESHDLNSPKIHCCEKTEALFRALERYENLMIPNKGGIGNG